MSYITLNIFKNNTDINSISKEWTIKNNTNELYAYHELRRLFNLGLYQILYYNNYQNAWKVSSYIPNNNSKLIHAHYHGDLLNSEESDDTIYIRLIKSMDMYCVLYNQYVNYENYSYTINNHTNKISKNVIGINNLYQSINDDCTTLMHQEGMSNVLYINEPPSIHLKNSLYIMVNSDKYLSASVHENTHQLNLLYRIKNIE